MLETIMKSEDDLAIDIVALKQAVKEHAKEATDEAAYDTLEAGFMKQFKAEPLAVAEETKPEQPAEAKNA
jgi:tRNA A-37 threonylcarbamoyl transferase component Bud32